MKCVSIAMGQTRFLHDFPFPHTSSVNILTSCDVSDTSSFQKNILENSSASNINVNVKSD